MWPLDVKIAQHLMVFKLWNHLQTEIAFILRKRNYSLKFFLFAIFNGKLIFLVRPTRVRNSQQLDFWGRAVGLQATSHERCPVRAAAVTLVPTTQQFSDLFTPALCMTCRTHGVQDACAVRFLKVSSRRDPDLLNHRQGVLFLRVGTMWPDKAPPLPPYLEFSHLKSAGRLQTTAEKVPVAVARV